MQIYTTKSKHQQSGNCTLCLREDILQVTIMHLQYRLLSVFNANQSIKTSLHEFLFLLTENIISCFCRHSVNVILHSHNLIIKQGSILVDLALLQVSTLQQLFCTVSVYQHHQPLKNFI